MPNTNAPGNIAITALTHNIATTLDKTLAVAIEADENLDVNGKVGALMHMQATLEAVQAQLAAALAIHRSN